MNEHVVELIKNRAERGFRICVQLCAVECPEREVDASFNTPLLIQEKRSTPL